MSLPRKLLSEFENILMMMGLPEFEQRNGGAYRLLAELCVWESFISLFFLRMGEASLILKLVGSGLFCTVAGRRT